jgi:hypothetical protein
MVPAAGAIARALALVGPLMGWSPTVHAKINATGRSAATLLIRARRIESLCMNVIVEILFFRFSGVTRWWRAVLAARRPGVTAVSLLGVLQ